MSPLWLFIGVPVGIVILSFCCGLTAGLGWRAGRALPRPAGTASVRVTQQSDGCWVTQSPRRAAPPAGRVDIPTRELRPYTVTSPHTLWSPEGTRR